jgi:hypothetical protein
LRISPEDIWISPKATILIVFSCLWKDGKRSLRSGVDTQPYMLTIFADFPEKINGKGEKQIFFQRYDTEYEVNNESNDL